MFSLLSCSRTGEQKAYGKKNYSFLSEVEPHRYLLYQEGIPLLDVVRIIVSCFKCHAILCCVFSFLCNCLNVFDMPALDVLFW